MPVEKTPMIRLLLANRRRTMKGVFIFKRGMIKFLLSDENKKISSVDVIDFCANSSINLTSMFFFFVG